jgi:hypothetical protein
MPSIRSDNKLHEASCSIAEGSRQQALAGANTVALCKAADIAFYRAVVASGKLNGVPYGEFLTALHFLGADP